MLSYGPLVPGAAAVSAQNPTENIYGMLTTKVVLKEGKVVVDKR